MEDGFVESTLTAPLIDENAELVGVCQLRNKRGSRAGELVGQFKEEDELLVPGFTVQVWESAFLDCCTNDMGLARSA